MLRSCKQNKPLQFAFLKVAVRVGRATCRLLTLTILRPQTSRALLLIVPLAGAISCPTQPSEAKPTISVTGARLWAHPGYTRFVLEMSAEAYPQLFFLPNPNRLVIDFPQVDFAIPRMQSLPRKRIGVISGYRYGLLKPGISRLVLDLAIAATVKHKFLLPPLEGKPYRFVIDLEPSTESAFQTAVANSTMSPTTHTIETMSTTLLSDDVFTIVIDAGHGGVDPGAIGRNGIYEKDVALAAAKELADIIKSLGSYHVVLTRAKDIFLPLRERVAIGRGAGADLFLSLHADSIRNMKVHGAHVYSLSETASDKEAEALAAKENKADIIAGINLAAHPPDVSSILLDLSQRETNNFSAEAANVLVQEWQARGLKLLQKPHRQAGFAVLKAPDVPSILVELGFLSNPGDVKKLSRASGRAPLLEALTQAVDRYFKDILSER